jgi:hypothetical protein
MELTGPGKWLSAGSRNVGRLFLLERRMGRGMVSSRLNVLSYRFANRDFCGFSSGFALCQICFRQLGVCWRMKRARHHMNAVNELAWRSRTHIHLEFPYV